VDYHKLPVTVVAVGGGLAYGALGYSHHAVQDYGLFRSFPNTLIAAPGDPMEVRACLRYLVANPQPSYLRLGKAGEPSFHSEVPEVCPGLWLPVAEGDDGAVLLTTGATLQMAMETHRIKDGARMSVRSLPLWGMASKSVQVDQVRRWARIETLEDHLSDGGMGSWLLESLNNSPILRERISLRALDSRVCGTVGGQKTLNVYGGLAG